MAEAAGTATVLSRLSKCCCGEKDDDDATFTVTFNVNCCANDNHSYINHPIDQMDSGKEEDKLNKIADELSEWADKLEDLTNHHSRLEPIIEEEIQPTYVNVERSTKGSAKEDILQPKTRSRVRISKRTFCCFQFTKKKRTGMVEGATDVHAASTKISKS